MADFIYGIHPVLTFLTTGVGTTKRLLMKRGNPGPRLREIRTLAELNGCQVEYLPRHSLDEITSGHQGVILYKESAVDPDGSTTDPDFARGQVTLDSLLSQEPVQNKSRLFLILDGVTDPRNMGACLRSAATMGVDAVIAPRSQSAPLNPVAIKTASGGADLVPYLVVPNIARSLKQLQGAGCWVVGTSPDAEQPLSSIDLSGDLVLVVGSEDSGLRRNTRQHCDFLAKIPMIDDSLGFNVSVAAGIILYEVYQQRHKVNFL